MKSSMMVSLSLCLLALAVNSRAQLPSYVDNSTDPATVKYFPPVFTQVGNSCGPSSSTYYALTYMTGKARDWDVQNDGDGSKKFSPKFVYNQINGLNDFTYMEESYQMLAQGGAPTLAEYPDDGNTAEWCVDASVWRSAMKNRITDYGYFDTYRIDGTDAGIERLKEYINNGYVLNYWTGINSWQYKTVSDNLSAADDDPFVGENACHNVSGNSGGHFMVCVGYHDNLWIDCDGDTVMDDDEIGAIKVVNSWGGAWKNAGFCWVAYKVLKSKPSTYPALDNFYWMEVREYYEPEIIAEFTLNAARRDHINILVGIGDPGDAVPDAYAPEMAGGYYKMLYNSGGAYNFDGASAAGVDGDFAMDLTELKVENTDKRWFLQVYDDTAANPVSVKDFKLVKLDGTAWTAAAATPVLPTDVDNATTNFYIDYNLGGDLPLVTAPADGTGVLAGDDLAIAWETNSSGENVQIQLFRSGALLDSISAGTPNDGAYSWSVPYALTAGGGYYIRITDLTDGKQDDSGVFSLFQPIDSFPYAESFESGLGSWAQSVDDDTDWTVDSGTTPSGTTGPDGASDGTYYLYTEASSHLNETASIEAKFDLSALAGADLTFDYHMYGAGMGGLYVDIHNGVWNNAVWSRVGQQQAASDDPWGNATVDLDSYVGGIVKIRFRGVIGATFASDMAIDNIAVTETVPVPAISIADDGEIIEGAENGEIITVTLVNAAFAGILSAENWTVTNLPAGVSKGVVTRVNDTEATIALSGNRAADYDSDITNVTVSCAADEHSGAGELSDNTGVTLTAKDEVITYSSDTFTEALVNNGSIINTLTLTLSGDSFAADAVSGGHVAAGNIPDGLSAKFTRNSDTQISFRLSGAASSHADINDIANLAVTFDDGAFTGAPASYVTGASRADLVVDFRDPDGAADYTVGMVGADFMTIVDALAACSGGEIIEIIDPVHTAANVNITIPVIIRGHGPSNTIVQGDAGPGTAIERVFYIDAAAPGTVIKDMTIRYGNSAGYGGAVYVRGDASVISNCVVRDSRGAYGGGIACRAADLSVTGCSIQGNIATSDHGGGVYLYDEACGADIDSCAISGNNTARDGGGVCAVNAASALTMTNCTVSDNLSVRDGGGVSCGASTVLVSNCTIADNDSTDPGYHGGGLYIDTATVEIINSIVSGNSAAAGGNDIHGTVDSASYCLIEDTTDASFTSSSNLTTGVDPLLAALAGNGGPTQTRIPGAAAALRAIPRGAEPHYNGSPAKDQRGYWIDRWNAVPDGENDYNARSIGACWDAAGPTPARGFRGWTE